MSSKATCAEFRDLQSGMKRHRRPIQSTNCAVGFQLDADGRQSRAGSLLEAVANVIAGFLVALLSQQVILPLFGIHVGLAVHIGIAAHFTLLSLLRSYLLRRLFDHLEHVRRNEDKARKERLRQAFSRGGS